MEIMAGVGAILACIAVALGAFGAHALRGRLPAERLAVFQTGVQYQMYHALGMMAGPLAASSAGARSLREIAVWLFALGILLFSGSLYALALSGIRRFGAVTPLGGLCFLAGWILLAFSFWN